MRSYLKTKDFFKSQEEFELFLNEDLEMLTTSPRPKSLEAYYDSKAYISHTDDTSNLIAKLYQRVKKYNLKSKLKLIQKYTLEGNTLLDVGAGTGDFLIEARGDNWQVFGIEPNSSARMLAQKKGQHLEESMKTLKDQEFSVITLWHVLEHLPDLEHQIEMLKGLLQNNGFLFVAVPNFKSFDAQHYGKFWAAFDVPRHLWHFSKKSIKMLFEAEGFKLVATKPMVFDAFYVSLLSEKYKGSKLQFFKGFLIGLLSNIKAIFTGQYSSLIYILQKT